jgi:hypothetical protein
MTSALSSRNPEETGTGQHTLWQIALLELCGCNCTTSLPDTAP